MEEERRGGRGGGGEENENGVAGRDGEVVLRRQVWGGMKGERKNAREKK